MVSANAYPVMGGVETHLYEVAPRIARMGFDVTVLTTDRSGALPAREEVDGVAIMRLKAWPRERDYYIAPALYGQIVKGRWDLLHCHGYQTFVPPLALFAAARARVPYVVTFHSGGHPSQIRSRLRGAQQLAMRPLLARAKVLIAVSEFEARLFPRRLHIPASRFVTIPNGAELPPPDDDTPVERDGSLILSVGRLERYKGHHRVIEALPHLQRLLPQARLLILGAGPYEAELRRLAARLGVADRVDIRRIDPQDRHEMARTVTRAGLVTLLSEYEANPVAVMEALSLGQRVLVADTSGLSELARRGLASAISLRASADETAQAIYDRLQGPPPPKVALPTWDCCAEEIAKVYRSVLDC
jgi:glycosyltransferase involved in cell wall biosynthesis